VVIKVSSYSTDAAESGKQRQHQGCGDEEYRSCLPVRENLLN
jgi:hypothetical protein